MNIHLTIQSLSRFVIENIEADYQSEIDAKIGCNHHVIRLWRTIKRRIFQEQMRFAVAVNVIDNQLPHALIHSAQ